MKKSDNIDVCINILYDYIYKKNKETCYNMRHLIKDDIIIPKIKKKPETKDIEYYINTIFEEDKFRFINEHNNKYVYKRHSESHSCNIRIGFYEKSEERNISVDELTRKENVNFAMKFFLSQYVLDGSTNNILLPIMNIDIPYKDMKKIIKENSELNKIKNLIKEEKIEDILFIEADEHYYKSGLLSNYIIKNGKNMTLNEWKVLFFQLLYVLYIIQKNHNNFRHNNFRPDLISYYEMKNNNKISHKYQVEDINFTINNPPIIIKIDNFEKSVIQDIIDNDDIDEKLKKRHRYFDLHYFFNILLNHPDYENVMSNDVKDNLKEFFDTILPDRYNAKSSRLSYEDMYLDLDNEDEYQIPENLLLNNDLFKDFRNNKIYSESSLENMSSYEKKSIRDSVDNLKPLSSYISDNLKSNNIYMKGKTKNNSDSENSVDSYGISKDDIENLIVNENSENMDSEYDSIGGSSPYDIMDLDELSDIDSDNNVSTSNDTIGDIINYSVSDDDNYEPKVEVINSKIGDFLNATKDDYNNNHVSKLSQNMMNQQFDPQMMMNQNNMNPQMIADHYNSQMMSGQFNPQMMMNQQFNPQMMMNQHNMNPQMIADHYNSQMMNQQIDPQMMMNQNNMNQQIDPQMMMNQQFNPQMMMNQQFNPQMMGQAGGYNNYYRGMKGGVIGNMYNSNKNYRQK